MTTPAATVIEVRVDLDRFERSRLALLPCAICSAAGPHGEFVALRGDGETTGFEARCTEHRP